MSKSENRNVVQGGGRMNTNRRQFLAGAATTLTILPSARMVRAVVGPGPSEDELHRTLDRVLGSIYYRLLLTGDPVDDEHLWQLVLDILPPPGEIASDVD